MFGPNPKFLYVVELGIIKDVQKYIDAKYNINIVDEYGRSATIIAAERNDFEMLKMLVDAGAKLDVKDKFESSPLEQAKKNNNQEMIDFIENKIKDKNTRYIL